MPKRFYAQTLLKGFGPNNTSKTYTTVNNVSELDIINKCSKHIYNLTKTSLDEDSKCSPTIFWLPKVYKTPIKAPKCSLKPLPFLGHY